MQVKVYIHGELSDFGRIVGASAAFYVRIR